MPARFDPDRQLHLSLRKRLAARLLRVQCANEFVFLTHKIDLQTAAKFQLEIDAIIEDEIIGDQDLTLIQFLQKISERLLDSPTPAANENVRELCKVFKKSVGKFDCAECGCVRSEVCNGVIDRKLFKSNNGALCLSFLHEIVETFCDLANKFYETYAGDFVPTDGFPDVVIRTLPKTTDATLPIDGEFIPPKPEDGPNAPGVIAIKVPKNLATMDEALFCLPYIVFHEIFVHRSQGVASSKPGFTVGNDCAFTEGAIDALACQLLLDDILMIDGNIPSDLRVLRPAFRNYCEGYHSDRFDFSQPDNLRDLEDPTIEILQARWAGRTVIFQYLQEAQKHCCKPPDWTQRILASLNLQLDRGKRRDFHQAFDVLWGYGQGPMSEVELSLDRFLETGDAVALLNSLQKIRLVRN